MKLLKISEIVIYRLNYLICAWKRQQACC